MYLQPVLYCTQEGELYSVGRCWKARSFKLALVISCIVFITIIVVVTVTFLITLVGEFCSPNSCHYLSQDSFSLASSPGSPHAPSKEKKKDFIVASARGELGLA